MSKIFFIPITESEMESLIGVRETAQYETDYPELVKVSSQKLPETFRVTVSDLPPVTVIDIDL